MNRNRTITSGSGLCVPAYTLHVHTYAQKPSLSGCSLWMRLLALEMCWHCFRKGCGGPVWFLKSPAQTPKPNSIFVLFPGMAAPRVKLLPGSERDAKMCEIWPSRAVQQRTPCPTAYLSVNNTPMTNYFVGKSIVQGVYWDIWPYGFICA